MLNALASIKQYVRLKQSAVMKSRREFQTVMGPAIEKVRRNCRRCTPAKVTSVRDASVKRFTHQVKGL